MTVKCTERSEARASHYVWGPELFRATQGGCGAASCSLGLVFALLRMSAKRRLVRNGRPSRRVQPVHIGSFAH